MPYDFQSTDSWLKCPQHKVIYRLSAILVKIPMAFYTELEQNFSQFIWKHQRLQIVKAVLKKKNGAGGINLPDFRLYHKDSVINIVWYCTETEI